MNKEDEKVLVVSADIIFKEGSWQGIKKDRKDYYLNLIENNYQFLRRGSVETDPSWQQIIPYVIFSCKDKFFIYKYLPKAGEKRLVDTYQLGVGGHINEIDIKSGNVLETGMMREWLEEVDYKGELLEKKFVGLLNDDSQLVEAVHLGLVYHFFGSSPGISIKEKEKMEGELVNIKNIGERIKINNGVWVKIVYNEYIKGLII